MRLTVNTRTRGPAQVSVRVAISPALIVVVVVSITWCAGRECLMASAAPLANASDRSVIHCTFISSNAVYMRHSTRFRPRYGIVGKSAFRSPTTSTKAGRDINRASTKAKIAAGLGMRQCRTSIPLTHVHNRGSTTRSFG